MMAWWHRNAFHIAGPLLGESTAHPCISLTKDRECGALRFHSLLVWRFMRTVAWVAWIGHQMVYFPSQKPVTWSVDVWSAPEQTAKQNNWDGGDFRCHRAHYDITLMDRDFRRRDAHVVASYWGHDLVLTTQGKCFPNFKTRPCFKRYVSLQWRCMSDRVRSVSTRLCSRNFFLIYSVRCVTLPSIY